MTVPYGNLSAKLTCFTFVVKHLCNFWYVEVCPGLALHVTVEVVTIGWYVGSLGFVVTKPPGSEPVV